MKINGLTAEEKVDLIKELVISYRLTSYEVSKNTNISISAIDFILDGKTKQPRKKTLQVILVYLNSLNTSNTNNLEPNPEYSTNNNNNLTEKASYYIDGFEDLKIDEKLNALFVEIKEIKEVLFSNALKNEDIQKNSDLIAKTHRSLLQYNLNFKEIIKNMVSKNDKNNNQKLG